MSRHRTISHPATGAIAAETSAAVVPFARFCAITAHGPAAPLMLSSDVPRMLSCAVAVVEVPLSADSSRERVSRDIEALRGVVEMRAARGLLRECRSCVQAVSMDEETRGRGVVETAR